MVVMPLTFSIAEGLAAGFVAASIADLVRPGGRRLSPPVHGLAALFLVRWAWLA